MSDGVPDEAANIVGKKNGAVVFIGIVLIGLACVLGLRTASWLAMEKSGNNAINLRTASRLGNYAATKDQADQKRARTKVEGAIAAVSLIAGIILLCLKQHLCSNCGTKVGIETAKLCGSCGSTFVRPPGGED